MTTRAPAEWPVITVQTAKAATVEQLVARAMGLYQHRAPDTNWELPASILLTELEKRVTDYSLPRFEREAMNDSFTRLNRALYEAFEAL